MTSHELADTEHDHIMSSRSPSTSAIFGALMVLTIVTVAAAFVDLGNLNIIVAIAIARGQGDARRAVLHAREVRVAHHETGRHLSLVWLGFLFCITLTDYLTRGWLMAPPLPQMRARRG